MTEKKRRSWKKVHIFATGQRRAQEVARELGIRPESIAYMHKAPLWWMLDEALVVVDLKSYLNHKDYDNVIQSLEYAKNCVIVTTEEYKERFYYAPTERDDTIHPGRDSSDPASVDTGVSN